MIFDAPDGDDTWEIDLKRSLAALPAVNPPPGYFERLIRHQRPRYSRRLVACGVLAAALTALGISVDANPDSELAGLLEIPLDGSEDAGEHLLVVLGAEPDGTIVDGPGTDLADLVPVRINGVTRRDFGVEAGVVVAWYGAVRVTIADRATHADPSFERELRPDPSAADAAGAKDDGASATWIFDRGANRFSLSGPESEVGPVAAGLDAYLDGDVSRRTRIEATVRESLRLLGFPT
jgi:hypothetical protein